jgi:hypothetical protein
MATQWTTGPESSAGARVRPNVLQVLEKIHL